MDDGDPLLEWLYGLQMHGIKLGLTNITELLRRLGNPERGFRSIHVAGTDGKGSICACIDSILRASGFRTGLYTSPHLMHFNERIKVDGEDITDGELSELSGEVMGTVQDMAGEGMMCTFFEVTTALAFLHFRDKNVDYAVVEVGMGGRFDATNVLVPVVCVIANISMEHTEYLGDTIQKIAFEKAGIIKHGVPCVTLNCDDAFEVIGKAASEMSAPLTRIRYGDIETVRNGPEGPDFEYKGEGYTVSIPGRHQANNASLAIEAVSKLDVFGRCVRCNMRRGLSSVRWPCRMERLRDMPIILDVTHTRAGSADLARDIGEIYGRVLVVFGVLGDKDIDHITGDLARIADKVIVTTPDSVRAAPIEKVAAAMRRRFDDVAVTDDVSSAMDLAMRERKEDETILVTGSFYMAEDALKWLKRTSV